MIPKKDIELKVGDIVYDCPYNDIATKFVVVEIDDSKMKLKFIDGDFAFYLRSDDGYFHFSVYGDNTWFYVDNNGFTMGGKKNIKKFNMV